MEGVYYFGEHLRWNLGFLNPNIAGAFIAILIAFLSLLREQTERLTQMTKTLLEMSNLQQVARNERICCGFNVHVGLRHILSIMQGI